MKRQTMWKVALGLGAFCGAGAVLHVPGIAFLPAAMAILFLVDPANARRCGIFEAALPIRGRDLFFARILGNLLALWSLLLPVFVRLAVSGASAKGESLIVVFEAGSILTLAVAAIQSVEVDQFEAPVWWRGVVVVLAAAALVAALAVFFDSESRLAAFLPAGYVAIACMLAAGALLAQAWARAPSGLQIEPQKAKMFGKSRGKRLWLPSFAWSPMLGMMWSLSYVFLFCAAITSIGADLSFAVLYLILSTNVLSTIRNESWVFALPVSRQKIFLCLCFPAILGVAAGGVLSRWLKPRPAAVVLCDGAIAAVAFFLGLIAMHGLTERQRSPWRFRFSGALLALSLVAVIVSVVRGRNPMRIFLGREIVAALPGHVGISVVAVLLIVAGVYWLALGVFYQLEPKALPVNRYAKASR